MKYRMHHAHVHALAAVTLLTTACADEVAAPNPVPVASPLLSHSSWDDDSRGGPFRFKPLPSSSACTIGGNPEKPFMLPDGFDQVVFAREGDGGTLDLWDMNTQNETGKQAGRYLYRTHEIGGGGQVSVTDLKSIRKVGPTATSETRILAQRVDWERFDGIVWTPWGTILAAEETNRAALPDPQVPQAQAGLVYELFVDLNDPSKLDPSRERIVAGDGTTDNVQDGIRARPAVGSRSHEGLRFDPTGNLYGIAESSPPTGGYIYKFVPDRKGDLSKGQLSAIKIVEPDGDRTGKAIWVPLDRVAVQASSDAEATRKTATGYGRPEDVETATSTGTFNPWVLFVAITSENRVLAIDLQPGKSGDRDDDDDGDAQRDSERAFVYDYVRAGVNAPADFSAPDNLALDKAGNLFIAEDPGGAPPAKVLGDDIWAAKPGHGKHQMAKQTVRFASITDCVAEPSGIYFDLKRSILYVNAQHRGGDGRDLTVMIFPTKHGGDDHRGDDDRRDDK